LKKGQRYDVSGLVEAQFQPGSRGRVLRNLPGIKTKREMDRVEVLALARAMDLFVRTYEREHRFTASDICQLHKVWLDDVYEWAGNYRQVNVSKGGFTFAMATQVPVLMQAFEAGMLRRYTPCNFERKEEVARALGETHTELMLIHPFREGSGRVGRILATLMALQAGLPFLDFSSIRGRKKQQYFAAVRAGLGRDYGPMERVFREVIEKTLAAA